MMKTRAELFAQVQTWVRSNHPYEVPEIISIDINNGSDDYLKWITENTEGGITQGDPANDF